MVVKSKHLIAAFNAVVGSYLGTNFFGDTVTIRAPYCPLIRYRSALSRYRSAQPACHDDEYAATTAKHIDVLLEYLDKAYGNQIREEEARHKRSPPVATFEWLWLAFKPGEVVYRKIHDVWTAFVIGNVSAKHRADNGKVKEYKIDCWNIRYRQERMQRTSSTFEISPFPGEQALHTLAGVPAAFFPEDLDQQGGLTMAQRQIKMGKMYWELVKRPSYKEYDGRLVDRDGRRGGHLAGRVIVDAEGYDRFAHQAPDQRMQPGLFPNPGLMMPAGQPKIILPQFAPQCTCDACTRQQDPSRARTPGPFADFEGRDPRKHEPPRNDLYFLVCSPDIPALLLADRRWGHVRVDRLAEVKCDTEAFGNLVLDPGVKLTVKALIGKFAAADGTVSPWPRDFVRGKGEGRIFLLHGSPGVGKTCTAECVAELTHRPLLAITSGDLAHPNVERSLGYFLALGERYGALVLLDEADVYLERRRTRDLRRNALVSVFLRALEYYRGVLFLTTNRIESFDPAFTSRIHVALHYRRLTNEDRDRIWTNNFDRLERDNAGKVVVSRGARDYVSRRGGGGGGGEVSELKLNGREIRNALQTAVALAETDAAEEGVEEIHIAEKHLRQVVKMSRGFKEFLLKRRGYDDEEEEDEEDEYGEGAGAGRDSDEERRGPPDMGWGFDTL
ncbi:P-loop containing nucleoside triphosphate hydrolase protein [Cryphonectria parasitica EP155]|uniref:P-loop containing nucleoside triphosphate hydrolase protein n=1 Tax=Cryphonectria parasitica (strain ATCC 38755 / EP155) TaxID=660469 RepID=A0A9P4Y0U9_CRYP1|nr:P-loop containing nucleoside triphosphate hydrolase protein [Cryphonectria parasitica EP155]KAF3764453.1 P-loop containing nucleoside triphosphate hydrolase protein [Cryphonectria parasitica EP155]